MHQAAELLASLGHEVEEAAPPLPGKDGAARCSSRVFGPAVALGDLLRRAARRARRRPTTRSSRCRARSSSRPQQTSSVGYLGAVAQLQALARAIVAFFAEYDLLLTPGAGRAPAGDRRAARATASSRWHDLARSGAFTPFTSLFNVTGQPAITVPIGFGEDNLPTSVQIVGKPLGEDTLLQVAAQIETARPWAHQRPPERVPRLS